MPPTNAPAARPRVRWPLIKPQARPAALRVVIAAPLVFGLFTVILWHKYGPTGLDRLVGRHLITNPYGYGSAGTRAIANLGGPVWIPVLTTVAAIVLLGLRHWRAVALLVIVTPLASALSEWLFKPLIDRSMVHGTVSATAFPSGHATGIFTFGFALSTIALGAAATPRARLVALLVSVAAATAGIAVSLALVAAQYHYITDTVGGALVALTVVLGTALLIDTVADALTADRAIHTPSAVTRETLRTPQA
jgi:undecaprenyl-diphosphatase